MQKRYLIDMFATRIEGDIQRVAESHELYLLETHHSAQAYGIGEEKRFDVVRRTDNVPIALVALSQQKDGTQLLITDEPHCQRQGDGFRHDAFADFADLVLAGLGRDWKIESLTTDGARLDEERD